MTSLPATVTHLRCPNPGPMTLTGTNTYVLALGENPTGVGAVVTDPGPDATETTAAHRQAVVDAAVKAAQGGVVAVLLTHHHEDHSAAVPVVEAALRAAGCSVQVYGGGQGRLPGAFGPLQVVSAPGHTQDSVAFLLPARRESDDPAVLFSGDTLLGGSSSFVADPDGNLTDYLATLESLGDLVGTRQGVILAPGHGEVGLDAAAVIAQYRKHRAERLDQVRKVLEEAGPSGGVDDVVAAVYGDIGPELRPAVEAIVRAQVKHLRP